jgi:FkbM family methyltransferase
MTLQNKVVRSGVDVSVLVRAATLRIGYDAAPPAAGAFNAHGAAAGVGPGWKESPVRKLLQPLLRRLKPLVRSILWRLRGYWNRPLEEHLARVEALLAKQQASLDQLAAQVRQAETFASAAARRIAVPCANGEILLRTEVGYLLCSSSDPAVLAVLLESGELERGTRLLIQRLLRPGDVFVDIGANLGLHTLAAARTLQGRGRVVAFEPSPETHRLLQAGIWLNGFSSMVDVHQAAVSSHAGRQAFHLGATSGHSSLLPLDPQPGHRASSVDVTVVRLDEVLPAGTAVNLIKIDVEGAELDVLAGARSVIEANPSVALIAEYGPSHVRRSGHTAASWLQPFQALGLEYRAIDPHTGQLAPCDEAELEKWDSVNLFFARPSSDAWARAGSAA